MIFLNINQFRKSIYKYAVAKGIKLNLKLNQPYKVRAKCKAVDCPWVLYASIERKTHNL